MKEQPLCYRENGRFDFGAFLRLPQVWGSLVLIVLGLGGSVVLCRLRLEDSFWSMALPMACCFLSLLGAERINASLGLQRAMRDQQKSQDA